MIMNSYKIKNRMLFRFSVRKAMIYVCMTVCVLLAGCGGGSDGDIDEPGVNPPVPEPEPEITIAASTQSITLSSVGDEQTFTVTTQATDWSVASSESWLSAVKEGNNTVKIQAAINLNNLRTAVVTCTVSGRNSSVSVQVSQSNVTELQSDSLALADFFGATGGTSNSLAHPGVTVADGRVTILKLKNSNLSGFIPATLGSLTQLQYCDLSGNNLTGSLPAELNRLTQLEYLDLSENSLSGNVPDMASLTKLIVLDLSSNELTSLPVLPQSLSDMGYLALNNNNLSGNLPTSWSNYRKLVYIDLSVNTFTGNIPSEWSTLTGMKALHLYGNALSGTIPDWFESFTYLKSLTLNHNNLTGTIPANLGILPQLETLWLSQNKLTGEIPSSLLNNPHWNEWESLICPQQSGSGFTNCHAGTKSATAASLRPGDWGKRLKEEYSKH
jgi:Leucine-rich repeat (LRR) protein